MSEIFLTSCIGLDHDLVILDHFCNHYINLGVDPNNFILVLNSFEKSKISRNLKEACSILQNYGIEPTDVWLERYESEEKWKRVDACLTKKVKKDDWVIHPDADEFHELVNYNSYENFFNSLKDTDVNAGQGIQVDRLSQNYVIPNTVEKNTNIFDQFPNIANMSTLIGTAGHKLMFYKGALRANNGSGQIHEDFFEKVRYYTSDSNQHFKNLDVYKRYLVKNKPSETPDCWNNLIHKIREDEDLKGLIVHHFKWHSDCIEKLKSRIKTYIELQRPQVFQSIDFVEHYQAHGRVLVNKSNE